MTRILLVRHGSTDLLHDRLCGRTPGISLNEKGRKEAAAVAREIQSRHRLTAVYSSPLERSLETAQTIAEPQALSVAVEDGLNELDFGEWMGASFDDLHQRPEWKSYNQCRSLSTAPGGESLMNVQSRAWKSLSRIIARHPEATVASVTHGDVIRALLILLLGMPLDHILRFEIAPASITEISVGESGPVVHSVNLVSV